jgi:ABC-type polysaccharide/polyol phosphate export permease
MFCEYSDIFGKPNEGVHAERLFGMAKVDLVMTMVVVIIISIVFGVSMLKTGLIVFTLAQMMHVLFCVNTSFVNNILGIHFEKKEILARTRT